MPKSGRTWREKFTDAGRGVWLSLRDGPTMAVHLFAAVAVLTAACVLECDRTEWCLLIGCIGAVLAGEVFNCAIETMFHALDDATKSRMTGCLDRAAGAVLILAIASALIGVIVLGRRWLLAIGAG